ncbi:LOW QUALITY PROTEIN: hypothetical protein TorRG33x02_059830, partial [Trema orientale]
ALLSFTRNRKKFLPSQTYVLHLFQPFFPCSHTLILFLSFSLVPEAIIEISLFLRTLCSQASKSYSVRFRVEGKTTINIKLKSCWRLCAKVRIIWRWRNPQRTPYFSNWKI